ncbi:hypothetical protein D9756_004896 [Leucocoprinus leucothites]|uniref:Uncharacterized protein n=1 Tax=Leucocoprinus leucothites TaxID=201217 RepID=A0A8H5LKY0_9AGAR|nr:hypothetical protein D9756_004896 [Leucoagaricus leucothites]
MSSNKLLAAVSSRVSHFTPFRKSSRVSKAVLAFDITLVALSIRTGYLVDKISVPEHLIEQSFSALLKELRDVSECFSDILHLYEPSGKQSFIVNKVLLLNKLESLLDQHLSSIYPTFLCLPERGDVYRLDIIPPGLLDVLGMLLEKLKRATDSNIPTENQIIQLPQELSSTICIPLAAILLDYPIAYVPSSDRTSFLSGVPLVLYRCRIDIQSPALQEEPEEGKGHILLQFSCPEMVDDSTSAMSTQQISVHLESTFGPRIAHSLPGSSLYVDHEHITLDRVAL